MSTKAKKPIFYGTIEVMIENLSKTGKVTSKIKRSTYLVSSLPTEYEINRSEFTIKSLTLRFNLPKSKRLRVLNFKNKKIVGYVNEKA